MSRSLFRQQAIDEQKERLYGEVIISQPTSLYIFTSITLFIVISISILLISGSYARRESVLGYLVPDKGLVKIYASIKGVLSTNHIDEGQYITKGDLLFTVSTKLTNETGDDRDAMLLNELVQQKINLQSKIKQEEQLNASRLSGTQTQANNIVREISQLKVSIELQIKQKQLSANKFKMLKGLLNQGHISESTLQESEQLYLDDEVNLQTYQRQKIQLESRHADLLIQLKRIPLQWQSQLTDLQKNISDIEQRIVEISGRRNYSIHAPVSGRLTALQISEGQMLHTSSPLIAILPQDSMLQAELFLPTRAAGFITKGQTVFIRYGAFPYQHYGLHQGHVKNMAEVILAPNELPIPVTINEPVYKVTVDIDSQFVKAYGKRFPLQAGMLLDADIVLEQRTLGQWLLEPIYGLSGSL